MPEPRRPPQLRSWQSRSRWVFSWSRRGLPPRAALDTRARVPARPAVPAAHPGRCRGVVPQLPRPATPRRCHVSASRGAGGANGEGPLASSVAVEWQQTAIRTIFAETVPTPAPPVGAMYLSFMSLAVHDAAHKAQRIGLARGHRRRGDGCARRAARVLPGVPGSARRPPRGLAGEDPRRPPRRPRAPGWGRLLPTG